MDTARVHRLLRLIVLLQAGPARGVHDLMSELEISRRTLFRDLKQLEAAGIPYYHDAESGGYRIAKTFFLPPLSLTLTEALALLLLSRSSSSDPSRLLAGPAQSAINKLLSTVPESSRQACGRMLEKVSMSPPPCVDADAELLRYPTLQQACDEHRTVELEYQLPGGKPAERIVVDPYALHFAARAWYLFAHSHQHDEVRMFKLLRIASVVFTGAYFAPPSDFSVAGKLRNAWQLVPGPHDDLIELLFDAKVATNVAETRWHPTQEVEFQSDGRCRVRFTVSGIDEIAWWLCGYAGQVDVLAPKSLRMKLKQMHADAVDRLSHKKASKPTVVTKTPTRKSRSVS